MAEPIYGGMEPANLPIVILQGATFLQSFVWKSAGNPLDLTGFKARMQVRRNPRADSAYLTLTTENGGITLGGEAGSIQLYISDEDTAALSFGSAVYDLELETPHGNVMRLLEGTVTLSREVTRL